jgi:hypothetical protein
MSIKPTTSTKNATTTGRLKPCVFICSLLFSFEPAFMFDGRFTEKFIHHRVKPALSKEKPDAFAKPEPTIQASKKKGYWTLVQWDISCPLVKRGKWELMGLDFPWSVGLKTSIFCSCPTSKSVLPIKFV